MYATIVWGGDPTRDYLELEPHTLAEEIAKPGKAVEFLGPPPAAAPSAPVAFGFGAWADLPRPSAISSRLPSASSRAVPSRVMAVHAFA